MNFFAEMPPVLDRLKTSDVMNLLSVIAKCQERNITSNPATLQKKTGYSEQAVRDAVDVLINEGMIENLKTPYADWSGADIGKLGYKVLQKGWDKLGYKPLWID